MYNDIYMQIKNMFIASEIDFKNILKKDMLETCEKYEGYIEFFNYKTALKVITELYDDI